MQNETKQRKKETFSHLHTTSDDEIVIKQALNRLRMMWLNFRSRRLTVLSIVERTMYDLIALQARCIQKFKKG